MESAKNPNELSEDEIATIIVDCAYQVHKELGPGLLESAYEACLVYELRQGGLEVEQQLPLPIIYKGITVNVGYRMDLLVQKKVIVELKATDGITAINIAQLLSHLRLYYRKLGLPINFNVKYFKEGVKRVVNGL